MRGTLFFPEWLSGSLTKLRSIIARANRFLLRSLVSTFTRTTLREIVKSLIKQTRDIPLPRALPKNMYLAHLQDTEGCVYLCIYPNSRLRNNISRTTLRVIRSVCAINTFSAVHREAREHASAIKVITLRAGCGIT